MTFHFTDPDGDRLEVDITDRDDGLPAVSLYIEGTSACVHVPLDQVEELVAGFRDIARRAAGGDPEPQ